MIDRTTKDYKLMAERYGNEMADELCKISEEKAQAQTEADKQRKQFEMNEDKRIRERYGDDMADIFDKLEREGNSRYGDLFGKSNYSMGNDTGKVVIQGEAKKAYEEIQNMYVLELDKLYARVDYATKEKIKALAPLSEDNRQIALSIIMNHTKTRYSEYFKD